MRRLADGLVAILQADGSAVIGSPEAPGVVRMRVDAADVPLLNRVAQGLRADVALTDGEQATWNAWQAARMVTADKGPSDPAIEAWLTTLGAGFSWLVPAHPEAASLLELARHIHARRKLFVAAYGQASILPESAVARVLTMARLLEPGARVLLVGDDDFQSPLFAALGFDVAAVDIDPELVAFLTEITAERGLEVEFELQDLIEGLPPRFEGVFDLAITDPMSHVNCLEVFLTRAANAVKPGGHVLAAIHPLGRRELHKVLAELPLLHKDVFGQMSAYYDLGFADVDYRSEMNWLERTDAPVPHDARSPLPWRDVTVEELPHPEHGFAMTLGQSTLGAQNAPDDAAIQAALAAVSEVAAVQTVAPGTFMLTMHTGAHAHVVLQGKKARVFGHMYPHREVEDGVEPLLAALAPFLGRQETRLFSFSSSQACALHPVVR